MLEGESGTMKRGSADESEPRRTYSCLLARGTAPPPEAGADKGADKVWLVAVVTSHAIPATPPPPGLPRT